MNREQVEKQFEGDLAARDENKDLLLLANAFYSNLMIDRCEYGGIGIDDKRPFGNSDVAFDMLEIIQWDSSDSESYRERQEDYVHELYKSLIPFLQSKWKEYLTLVQQTVESNDPVRSALDSLSTAVETLESVHDIIQSLEDEKNMAHAKIERMQRGLQDIIER